MPAIDLHSPSPSSSASAWSGRRLSARFAAAWVAACLTAAGHAAEPAKVGPADAHWDAGAGTLQLSPAGESGARFELLALEFKIDGQWVTTAAGSPTISERNTHGLNFTVDVPSASAMRGRIRLDPVEEIYGFGETWNGRVAQRGTQIEIWNHNGTPDECAYLPYFVSTRNYAFLLDFGGRVHFDVGQTRADEIVFEAPTGSATFSVVFGDSIADTVSHVFQEFGAPALPPRWAFKPWFWLMSDPDQPSAGIDTLRGHHKVDMVDRLHNLDIPVGVVWMEPPWQTHRTSFVPNPEFSADLAGLIRDLNDRGVEVLAWTVPYTLPGSPNFPIAAENGYLARPAGGPDGLPANAKLTDSGELEGLFYNYIDFYNPEAFAWWKEEIKSAVDLGFAGFKVDAGQDLRTPPVRAAPVEGDPPLREDVDAVGGEVDREARVAEIAETTGIGRVAEPLDRVPQPTVRGGESIGSLLDDVAVAEARRHIARQRRDDHGDDDGHHEHERQYSTGVVTVAVGGD